MRRAGTPLKDGRCVVYWMQRAQRGVDNPALDLAIALGNELGLPVLVFLSIISNYPNANLRHYAFLNQGLPDIEEDLLARNVAFVVRRPPENQLEKLLQEVDAAVLVGDENHCREPERRRQVLAPPSASAISHSGCRCCGAFKALHKALLCVAHHEATSVCRTTQLSRTSAPGQGNSCVEASGKFHKF